MKNVLHEQALIREFTTEVLQERYEEKHILEQHFGVTFSNDANAPPAHV